MAKIFSLFGEIFIENEQAKKSIKETTDKAKESEGGITNFIGNVGKVGAVVATGVTAAATGLTAMVGKITETTGQIADNAAKAGLSAEEYQKWKFAAEQSGMTMETLQGAMVKSQKAFAEAKTGNEALAGTYAQLGVDLNSITNSEDAFNQTMAALAGVADEAQRNAMANDLFGRSYAELTPLLSEGADGMDALKQTASDLGMVMSNDAVAQGEALGDTLDQIKGAAMGVFNSLGTSLVPIVQTFADLILQNMPAIQSLVAGIAPALQSFLAQALPMLMQLAQQLLPLIFQVIQGLLPVAIALMPLIMSVVQAVLPPLVELLNLLLPPLVELLNLIIPPLTVVIQALAVVFGAALSASITNIMPIINGLMTVLSGLITFVTNVFTGNWKKAWEGVQMIFKGIFDSLVAYVKLPLNTIIDMINKIFSSIGTIQIPDWVPIVGGESFSLPKIPRLKVGMDYVPRDNYPAILHEGEAVLTKEENAARTSGGIDYTLLGDAVVDAFVRAGVTISVDERRFGRLVKSYA